VTVNSTGNLLTTRKYKGNLVSLRTLGPRDGRPRDASHGPGGRCARCSCDLSGLLRRAGCGEALDRRYATRAREAHLASPRRHAPPYTSRVGTRKDSHAACAARPVERMRECGDVDPERARRVGLPRPRLSSCSCTRRRLSMSPHTWQRCVSGGRGVIGSRVASAWLRRWQLQVKIILSRRADGGHKDELS